MTRTLNVCPVCASTRGHRPPHDVFRWICHDCGIAATHPAQIEVPSSITEHIADTEAAESAERKRSET